MTKLATRLEHSSTRMIRFAVIVLALSGVAGACELLALQVPGSLLYIGMLPGPIGALHQTALTLGLLLLAAGALMPWAYAHDSERRTKRIMSVLVLGTLLALVAQTYGAAQGMPGVQMQDLRPDARALFVVRHLGLLLVAIGLADLGLRILKKPH